MKTLVWLGLILPLSGHSQVGRIYPQLITLKGYEMRNATVTKVTNFVATIMFDGGGGTFPVRDLPENIRKDLSYDPDADAAFQKRQIAAKKALEEKAIHDAAERRRAAEFMLVNDVLVSKSQITNLSGEVSQVLTNRNGLILRLYVSRVHSVGGGGLTSIGAYGGSAYSTKEPGEEIVFVQGMFTNYSDGQAASFAALRTNTITLKDASGATHTLQQFVPAKPYLPHFE